MIEISYKILLAARMSNCRGGDECDLIELNPEDYEIILKKLALKNGKFIFHGSIVIPNPLVRHGIIRTFNKARFEVQEKTFEELNI